MLIFERDGVIETEASKMFPITIPANQNSTVRSYSLLQKPEVNSKTDGGRRRGFIFIKLCFNNFLGVQVNCDLPLLF